MQISDLLKVQQSHQARSLWKLKKCKRPEVLELNPLRYAVVRLGVFRKQCDVLGLLPLGNSSLACHYFASDCKEVFANFETKLMACCDGKCLLCMTCIPHGVASSTLCQYLSYAFETEAAWPSGQDIKL